MKRTLHVYLEDILESIEAIEEYTADLSETGFSQSRLVQDAVARRLHIIGEAAKSVPDEVRKRYSAIPWADVAGIRDRLAHAYFGVNMKLVWQVVQRDIAPLRQTVERMLAEMPKDI